MKIQFVEDILVWTGDIIMKRKLPKKPFMKTMMMKIQKKK